MNASIRLLHLLSFTMLLLLTACGGGGGGVRITGITPLVFESGADVTLSFTASDEVAQAKWTFAGGAIPATTEGLTPTIRAGAPGTYELTLEVFGLSGGTATRQTTFDVVGILEPPRITGVTPAGRAGAPGDTVTFEVELTGFADEVVWDFATAATPQFVTAHAATVVLGSSGIVAASVVVRNSAGEDRMDFVIGVSSAEERLNILAFPFIDTPPEFRGTNTVYAVTTGEPISWEWDFGAGALPQMSTEERPKITWQQPGTYTGQLTVRDELNDVDTQEFTYVVQQFAPIFEVRTLTKPLGAVGKKALLPVTIDHEPNEVILELTGGGEDISSDPARPFLQLTEAGRFTATITASNEAGTAGPVTIEFVVEPLQKPSTWTDLDLDGGNPDNTLSLAKLPGGELMYAAASSNGDITELNLKVADTLIPTDTTTWRDIPVGEASRAFYPLVLQQRVYVAFEAADSTIQIAWTDDVLAPSPVWTSHPLPLISTIWRMSDWTVIGDRPSAMAYDHSSAESQFLAAQVPLPTAAEDWLSYTIPAPSGDGRRFTSLVNYQERLAGCWTETNLNGGINSPRQAHLIRANLAIPLAWTDWSESLVTTESGLEHMVVSNGQLTGFGQINEGGRFTFRLAATEVADPQGPDDWEVRRLDWWTQGSTDLTVDSSTLELFDLDGRLLFARGRGYRPAVGHSTFSSTSGFLQLSRCAVPGVQAEDAWTRANLPGQGFGGAGAIDCETLSDGRPAFLYSSNQRGARLIYPDSPW